jgi:hypothetical protein
VEFSTASWRRAIAKLEDTESAWVKWNYLHETDFSLQTIIVQHGWQLFSETIKGRRIAGKTKRSSKRLSGWRRRTSKSNWPGARAISLLTLPRL